MGKVIDFIRKTIKEYEWKMFLKIHKKTIKEEKIIKKLPIRL